jgi:hypothetical protein
MHRLTLALGLPAARRRVWRRASGGRIANRQPPVVGEELDAVVFGEELEQRAVEIVDQLGRRIAGVPMPGRS